MLKRWCADFRRYPDSSRVIAYIRGSYRRQMSFPAPKDDAGGDDGENEDAANLRTPSASETQRWSEDVGGTSWHAT